MNNQGENAQKRPFKKEETNATRRSVFPSTSLLFWRRIFFIIISMRSLLMQERIVTTFLSGPPESTSSFALSLSLISLSLSSPFS